MVEDIVRLTRVPDKIEDDAGPFPAQCGAVVSSALLRAAIWNYEQNSVIKIKWDFNIHIDLLCRNDISKTSSLKPKHSEQVFPQPVICDFFHENNHKNETQIWAYTSNK